MKNIKIFALTYLITLLSLFALNAQTNIADSLVNLALSNDVKISSNLPENSRGVLTDILYNPVTKDYETSTTPFNEYGIPFSRSLSSIGLENYTYEIEWSELKNVNYISFGGTYPNQPQPNTNWDISYNDGSKWIIIERGTGGWIDSGFFVWKTEEPLAMKKIRVKFTGDGQNAVTNIHLRGRGVLNRYEKQDSIKATLIQFLPYKNLSKDEIEVKGTYKVYQDSQLKFEHLNSKKVLDSASNIKNKFPESKVIVKRPDLEYLKGEGGNLVATIKVSKLPTKRAMVINEPYPDTTFGGSCNSETDSLLLVSNKPYDFKDTPIHLLNVVWYIEKGLFNNGEPITDIEALAQGLIVLNCTSATIILKK